jgi:hypothetical protein
MFTKLSNTWTLFKQSVSVIGQNKTLLLFPVLISVTTLGILFFFAAPVALQPTGHPYLSAAHWEAVEEGILTPESIADLQKSAASPPSEHRKPQIHLTGKAGLYVMLIYFVSMFLAAFFNVAFSHEIFAALQGQPVTIRSGLAFASSRWKTILAWSLFAGLVGWLIQQMEQRFGFVGRWIIRMIGVAWSLAAVFAIPVLVHETAITNPVDVLRTSASRLKKTWGESLAGYIGMGAGSTVFLLLSLVLLAGFVAASVYAQNPLFLAVGFVIWFAALLAFSYVWSVAGSVFKCALYLYASTGVPPTPFTSQTMSSAWKTK